MDRRAVLRLLGLGAVGVSGCVGTNSDEEGTTRTGATEGTTTKRTTTSAEETATGDTSTTDETTAEATTAETTTTTEETTTEIGSCPDSILPDSRRYVHSDYGLRIVAEDPERAAVAVVGEAWRSVLRTNEMSDEDRRFVTNTDFEEFVVLVVQYTKSSGGHNLRVTDATIDGERVLADVCVVADGATQDAPTANLFVRLPYSGSPPTRAQVSIHRPRGTITVTSE